MRAGSPAPRGRRRWSAPRPRRRRAARRGSGTRSDVCASGSSADAARREPSTLPGPTSAARKAKRREDEHPDGETDGDARSSRPAPRRPASAERRTSRSSSPAASGGARSGPPGPPLPGPPASPRPRRRAERRRRRFAPGPKSERLGIDRRIAGDRALEGHVAAGEQRRPRRPARDVTLVPRSQVAAHGRMIGPRSRQPSPLPPTGAADADVGADGRQSSADVGGGADPAAGEMRGAGDRVGDLDALAGGDARRRRAARSVRDRAAGREDVVRRTGTRCRPGRRREAPARAKCPSPSPGTLPSLAPGRAFARQRQRGRPRRLTAEPPRLDRLRRTRQHGTKRRVSRGASLTDARTFATRPRRAAGGASPRRSSPHRSAFQRDRDRIIHSTAFRAAEAEDPGLRRPRGRPLPHPPDPLPRGRADRAHARPRLGLTTTSPRRWRLPTTSATRPSATPARTSCTR